MLFKLLCLCLLLSICMVGLNQMGEQEQRHKHLFRGAWNLHTPSRV